MITNRQMSVFTAVMMAAMIAWSFLAVYSVKVEASAAPRLSTSIINDSKANVIQVAPTAQLWDGTALAASGTNIAVTSNVVTITTAAAHGYKVGQRVVVDAGAPGLLHSDLGGTFVITVVGSTTAFSYALTHADVVSVAYTSATTAYYLSPVPAGTTQIPLTFPVGSFALIAVPTTTTVTDCTFSYTTSGGIGGTFHCTAGAANVIAGQEGDVVYIQRGSSTALDFQFAMGK